MQTCYLQIDQSANRVRRSPCRTCGEDTLHKGTICIHCGSNALAIPKDATPRKQFNRLERRRNWERMVRDRRMALRAEAQVSREKFEDQS